MSHERQDSADKWMCFAYDGSWNEELLVHLLSEGRQLDAWKDRDALEKARQDIRRRLQVPHADAWVSLGPEGRPSEEAIVLSLTPTLGRSILMENEAEVEEELTVEFHVLRRAPWPVATLMFSGSPLVEKEVTGIAELSPRLRNALGSPFVFGCSGTELTEPDLPDPRARVWGLTYYGAELVARVGRARLESAPVERLEWDDAGGVWLTLDPEPFADTPRKERRRRAADEHLGVRALFGSEESPS